jgi:hypothetical protein
MPAVPSPDDPLATRDDIRRLNQQLAQLRETLAAITHDQQVQFERIAQIQADIDLIRGAWAKTSTSDETYTGPERRRRLRHK